MLGFVLKSAFTGVLGAAKLGASVAGPAMQAAFTLGKPAAKVGIAGGGKALGFALRHPELTMVLGVGALGVYAANKIAAETSSVGEKEANQLARIYGHSTGFTPGYGSLAYDPNRMRMQNSTMGLVQGLHRGRR